MSAFTSLLKHSREFIRLTDDLQTGKAPLGLLGLSGVQKAHWISAVCAVLGKKALVLCPDEAHAVKLCADLNLFSEKAAVYPARDFHFRTTDSCSREYEQQRIGVLRNVLDGGCDFVLCSVDAAMQHTLPKKTLLSRSLTLHTGDEIPPTAVIEALLSAGYSRTPQVDGVGQFSLRGGILDVFPPQSAVPLRLEFWGDEIDTIALFDPQTQRRTDRVETVSITPATEVLFDSDGALLEKLRAFLPQIKGKGSVKAKAAIAADIDLLENGVRLSCLDRYLALAYETPATLFDYTDDFLLFVSESGAVKQKAQGAEKLLLEDIKLMLEEGNLTKTLACFALPWEGLLEIYERQGAVFADNLARGSFDLPVKDLLSVNALAGFQWDGTLSYLKEDLAPLREKGTCCIVAAGTEKSAKELAYDLETEGIPAHFYPVIPAEFSPASVNVIAGSFSSGFSYPDLNAALISLRKTGASATARKNRRKFKQGKSITSLEEIARGDYVVHAVHGIGIFDGIKTMTVDGRIKDYIKINFRGTDVLYLPVTQLDLVAKYISPKDTDKPVKLNRLGSDEWKKTKQRVRTAVKDMAAELARIYAKRIQAKGFAFSPDIDMQSDFERRFAFDETEDQLVAVDEIKRDMERPYPMDRLLCGDVGFGKTEVALRAAFKCVADGKQCAILVPTTILAFQHFQTIQKRFDGFPIEVEMLSRFRTPAERTRIKKGLALSALHKKKSSKRAFRWWTCSRFRQRRSRAR